MAHRHARRLLILAAVAALVGCAPGGTSEEDAKKIAELEERLAGQEQECQAIEDERDAAAPLPGLPEAEQEGPPLEEIPEVPALPIEVKDDDCPMTRWAIVRAETGNNCATYQAEISSWAEWCVPECDRPGITLQAVKIAAARCSEFCSSKGCGQRVTFIPPPNGCGAYQCFDSKSCPKAECPLLEYCSLIDINRVWNCFCRDLIPT
jgi:hypothetical protein